MTDTRRISADRLAFGLVVLAWGVQAIVAQSLLLREALVLMYGSEFAWGVVLFAWLLGVAVGGLIGGRLAQCLRRPDAGLVVVLVLLSLAVCVEIWVFRGARAWLGTRPGELLPLPRTALAAMLFVSPASALVGLSFPFACRLVAERGWSGGAGSLGSVYAWESAGSLVGGAAFSFWAVDRLAPIETALAGGTLVTAALLAWMIASRRRWAATLLGILAGAGLVCVIWAGDAWDRALVHRRWNTLAPGYALRAEAESRYQNLTVGQRADQYTLYCDGQIAADFPDPYSFAPLAHFWMCQHPAPRNVLVLGGGAEGLLSEVLKHPVQHVDFVEPDPRQIDIVEPFLPEADRAALRDPRGVVHHVDARYFIKTQRGRFDLVLARLPEPTSALRTRLYTTEFFGELRRAMTGEAVLCLSAAAMPGELSPLSAEYLASIRATVAQHFPAVTITWGDPAHVLAATRPGLTATTFQALEQRFAQRDVNAAHFHPLLFEEPLDPDKIARRTAELDAVPHPAVSTDLRPRLYLLRLDLWDRMTGGLDRAGGRVFERLRHVRRTDAVLVLAVAAALTLAGGWAGARRQAGRRLGLRWGAVLLSVWTTGFATMALSLVWLFAFQTLYGYVYQRIGWIIAVFMGGLVIGCAVAARRLPAASPTIRLGRRLVVVDVMLAGLAVAVPVVLPWLGRMQAVSGAFVWVEWVVMLMVAGTGVLGGAAFALAGGLRMVGGGPAAPAAGAIVGADHAGACLGALMTGILLVPAFGIPFAAVLLAGVKLTSAVLLWATGRQTRTASAGACQ